MSENTLLELEATHRDTILRRPYLYPQHDDAQFNISISEKKEFQDTQYNGSIYPVKERAEELCNAKLELAPYQMFVRNFLSNQTPYNGLLLYHGVGTGKTCSAITMCEEYRDYMKQLRISKKILIVANVNVQENYRTQLFDETKLVLVNDVWTMPTGCIGDKFLREINPMSMSGIPRQVMVRKIKTLIKNSYEFIAYTSFGTKLQADLDRSDELQSTRIIELEYRNRFIVIDEVQNIKNREDPGQYERTANSILRVTRMTTMKLLLLSATPMYNSPDEIIWILNILNQNDKRAILDKSDIFDSNNNLKVEHGKEIGKELLIRKATGYISYVRGENPYTFPYRIYPSIFAKHHDIHSIEYPRFEPHGIKIMAPIQHLSLYLVKMKEYQRAKYLEYVKNLKSITITDIGVPIQLLNIVYPELYDNTSIHDLNGEQGLLNTMIVDVRNGRQFYSYKPAILRKYGEIFSPSKIARYSTKISTICDHVRNSKGIVLIYSRYIGSGCIPMAFALESMGFTRYKDTPLLDHKHPKIGALTMKEDDLPSAKYLLICGIKELSTERLSDIKELTDVENKYGANIKVVIITATAAEGIDLKNIRQIHIMDPWHHLNRIEQTIGRGIRECSHKNLPFEERNCEIYLYATDNGTSRESMDLYMYRNSELKAIQIGKVSRVLKETAVDCLLNHEQLNFTEKNLDQTVTQTLSSGMTIKYDIGDKAYTYNCDYMADCIYSCTPNKALTDPTLDTYTDAFIVMNMTKLLEKIKELFKINYVYKKDDLFRALNLIRKYPTSQVYAALDQLLNDHNEYLYDTCNRKGHLINIGEYYMYNPIELPNDNLTMFERKVPIDYKRRSVSISIPSKIMTLDIKTTEVHPILDELEKKYKVAIQESEDVVRGIKDWYKLASVAITNVAKHEKVSRSVLFPYIIHHILEELDLEQCILLLNQVYLNELNEFSTKIKEYFDEKQIQTGYSTCIVLWNVKDLARFVLTADGWIPSSPQDDIQINQVLATRIYPLESFGKIVGGIVNIKQDRLFKFTNTDIEGLKGNCCYQSAKDDILERINKVQGYKYTKENTKGINTIQLCIEQELYLRYYNRKDKILWLDPVEAILNNQNVIKLI